MLSYRPFKLATENSMTIQLCFMSNSAYYTVFVFHIHLRNLFIFSFYQDTYDAVEAIHIYTFFFLNLEQTTI